MGSPEAAHDTPTWSEAFIRALPEALYADVIRAVFQCIDETKLLTRTQKESLSGCSRSCIAALAQDKSNRKLRPDTVARILSKSPMLLRKKIYERVAEIAPLNPAVSEMCDLFLGVSVGPNATLLMAAVIFASKVGEEFPRLETQVKGTTVCVCKEDVTLSTWDFRRDGKERNKIVFTGVLAKPYTFTGEARFGPSTFGNTSITAATAFLRSHTNV